MATIMSHAVVAVAIGSAFPPQCLRRRLWLTGAYCSIVPDFDVIGFTLGVNYGDFWGHRGFTHSICFAALWALFVTFAISHGPARKPYLLAYLFLATVSHGILDALTDGGLGVALFSPIDNTRYFFPFRPIRVSPIGHGFFSERGLTVIANELLWLWLPALLIIVTFLWLYRKQATPAKESPVKSAA